MQKYIYEYSTVHVQWRAFVDGNGADRRSSINTAQSSSATAGTRAEGLAAHTMS